MDLIDFAVHRRNADIARLQRIAASGFEGCRAAQKQIQALRTEELTETVRNRATGWRGAR